MPENSTLFLVVIAQGRAQDAAQLAEDPRRRDRADPQVDRGGCARELRAAWRRPRPSRSSSSSSTPHRWASRPARRRCPRTSRPSPSSPRPSPTRSWRWRRAPGLPWSRSPATSRCSSIGRPTTTWSAFCRSPRALIYVLKFSRNGDLLLAGGGRGGQSGLAVAWDVKKGTRVFEVGKEYDVVLAADISPDHGQVALGGPSKVVRVYNTADGSLAHEMRKHTEWITAAEFSPDGVLLATGDRNNGLIVWEAKTGREFHDLRGHQAAITDVSWRLDSNVLASSSEDGTRQALGDGERRQHQDLRRPRRRVASVRFAKDGRLLTTGRDRVVRLWDQNGDKQREFRAVRRPGARGRLQSRRVEGHRRRLDRRDPGLGHQGRTAAGEPGGQSRAACGPPRSGKDRPWPPRRPRPIRCPSNWRRSKRRSHGEHRPRAGTGEGRRGRASRGQANARRPAARPGTQGEDDRRRRGADDASRPPSSSSRSRPRPRRRPRKRSSVTVEAEKAATEALKIGQGRDREGPEPTRRRTTRRWPPRPPHSRPRRHPRRRPKLRRADETGPESDRADPGDRRGRVRASRLPHQGLAQATAAKNAAPQAATSARALTKAATLGVVSAREASTRAEQETSHHREGPGRRPRRAPDRDNRLGGSQKRARGRQRHQSRRGKGPGRKEGSPRCGLAKVQALKAEIDALAVEKKRL